MVLHNIVLLRPHLHTFRDFKSSCLNSACLRLKCRLFQRAAPLSLSYFLSKLFVATEKLICSQILLRRSLFGCISLR